VRVIFSPASWEDYVAWQAENAGTADRINSLIREIRRTPIAGTGKPEPLKGELRGWWSRRIAGEHRLVYRVSGSGSEQYVETAQCRGRY
jgi:toxin YoeB